MTNASGLTLSMLNGPDGTGLTHGELSPRPSRALDRYGLVKLGDNHLTVHRLTHRLLRADVDPTPEQAAATDGRVEITLVWVLFSDAARIRFQDFRHGLGLYVRLLAVGLPLTVVAGWGLAAWLLPGLGVWLALLVGAALAPTDAALGIPVVTNPAVPAPIRESGLNDGIATPVVMFAIAGAASVMGHEGATGPGGALLELAVGRRRCRAETVVGAGTLAHANAGGAPTAGPAPTPHPTPPAWGAATGAGTPDPADVARGTTRTGRPSAPRVDPVVAAAEEAVVAPLLTAAYPAELVQRLQHSRGYPRLRAQLHRLHQQGRPVARCVTCLSLAGPCRAGGSGSGAAPMRPVTPVPPAQPASGSDVCPPTDDLVVATTAY